MNQSTENPSTSPSRDRYWTIPNAICGIRLAGAPVLIALALADRPGAFLWLFVFLAMTDWIDGKLAILLNQRSVFGARLDSVADAALYLALLFGLAWLKWDVLRGELPWILVGIASYAAASIAGLAKFGRWPTYHTRAAKICWFLTLVAAVCLLGGWSIWPLRVAAVGLLLTNIESMLITYLSTELRTDVPSVLSVLGRPKAKAD